MGGVGFGSRAKLANIRKGVKKMQNLWKWISKNQGVTIALVLVAGLMYWTIGCESKVSSLVDPTKQVNRAELLIEVEGETARLLGELDQLARLGQLRSDELDKKDALRKQLMEFVAISAATGGVNPAGVAAMAFSIMGVGAFADNRIKDKVIKNRPLAKVAGRPDEAVS